MEKLLYYSGTTIGAAVGMVSYYVFPSCLLDFSELFLNEMVYYCLLFK
jgi:hypothetical protein